MYLCVGIRMRYIGEITYSSLQHSPQVLFQFYLLDKIRLKSNVDARRVLLF